MLEFREVNRNPKGHKTGDCTTRALAGAIGISWEQAFTEQYEMALHYCYDNTDKKSIDRILAKHGFLKMKQPRKWDNTKYMVCELDQLLTKKQMQEGVFVRVANHDTCIVNGRIEDLWNCGHKTVGNYWIKG